MWELTGKAAFVTGGASGIGLALGRAFAEAGMRVVLADIEQAPLAAAVKNLKGIGPDVRGVVCDVTDASSVDHAAKMAFDAVGKVHILCNNAGVLATGGIDNISVEEWRWVFDVNVIGLLNGVRAFLPHIRSHGEGGYIVNMASMAGLLSGQGFSPYSASKFAVVNMSEGLATQLQPFGIGVSVVCPGFVRTRIMESERNRPKRYKTRNPAATDKASFSRLSQLVQSGTEPSNVAGRVLNAIRNNELYVFTHPERRPEVEARFDAILAALEKAPKQ
jgi:NAD(P)-dependent dehydrogenase (short-subunit alcohol dehydrogenase family)